MGTSRSILTAGIVLLAVASTASAQSPRLPVDSLDPQPAPGAVFAGAAVGSWVGTWTGVILSLPFLLDESGNDGAILVPLALVGSNLLGTSLGMKVASHGAVPFTQAFAAAALGIGAGLVTGYAANRSAGPDGGAGGPVVAFSLGQGALASALALAWRRGEGRP